MNAIVLENQTPTLQQRPAPAAVPGEAVIRPTLVGVCSTDVELCKGYMNYRGVLGHEFVGVVEAVHDRADQHWLHQRVVGTINCACSRCDFCERGLREHCRDRTVLGIFRRDGCFAERFLLPTRNLLAVPEHLSDEEAVFTEPLAAAAQIPRQIQLTSSDRITVLGDGRLGLLVAQVLAKFTPHLRIVGKHPAKLALAQRLGLRAALLHDTKAGADQDVVVDCTGSPTGLPAALQFVRPRGTIVLKTTTAPSQHAAPDLASIVIHELTIVGSRCGPFDVALSMLARRAVDVQSLITHRMNLPDGPAALAASKGDAIKILLRV